MEATFYKTDKSDRLLGEGKHGKSTFINAILGVNAAPTDFLPKTWCFNRYISRKNPTDTVRLFIDPQLLGISNASHLKDLLSQKNPNAYRNLYEIVVSNSQAQSIMQIEETKTAESLGTTSPYFSPVMEIEWTVPDTNALLPGIRLVDTMGINQRLASSSHKTHLTWQYERADAVIWLISSDKIGSKDLRIELQNARRYSKFLLLVVNKWDKLSVEGQKKARIKLNKEYAGLVSAMIPVSSLAVVAARQGLGSNLSGNEKQWLSDNAGLSSEELFGNSGFIYLEEHLRRFQDGRQVVSRNLQIYSALRQKGIEFRKMADTAMLDTHANIALFELVIKKITDTSNMLQARAAESVSKLQDKAIARISNGIKSITYDSRSLSDLSVL